MLVTQFPPVEFNATESSFLMCTLKLDVSNPDMTYLGNEFDVRMILNNNIDVQNQSKFVFRVTSAKHTVRIYDTFMLDRGQNKSRRLTSVELFAKVDLGDVEFSSVEIKCLRFIEYPQIHQYSDD